MTRPVIFRYFKPSPEIIRIAVMMDVRFPLSLRNVEDLLHERGDGATRETFPWRLTVPFDGTGRFHSPFTHLEYPLRKRMIRSRARVFTSF